MKTMYGLSLAVACLLVCCSLGSVLAQEVARPRSLLGERAFLPRAEIRQERRAVRRLENMLFDYQTAWRLSTETDKPLVVFVTMEGCLPCETAWRAVIQPMLERGEFEGFVVTRHSREEDPALSRRFGFASYPALVVYHRDSQGRWAAAKRLSLISTAVDVRPILDEVRRAQIK